MIGVDVAVLFGLLAAGLWASTALAQHRRALRAAHVPPGIDAGTKAETYYRLCRRMAHELDGVLIRDSTLPTLSPEQRASIETVLRDWEDA